MKRSVELWTAIFFLVSAACSAPPPAKPVDGTQASVPPKVAPASAENITAEERKRMELYMDLASHAHAHNDSPEHTMYFTAEAAAEELIQIGDASTPVFLDALRMEHHLPIVLKSLPRLNDPRIQPALVKALEKWEGTYTELWVRQAMCRIDYKYEENFKVFQEIINAKTDVAYPGRNLLMSAVREDATLKGKALSIVGHIGDENAVKLILSAMENYPELLPYAVHGLMKTENPAATPTLVRLAQKRLAAPKYIKGDELQLTHEILFAVAACGGDEAFTYLKSLLESGNETVAGFALECMVRLRHPKSEALVNSKSNSPTEELCDAVCRYGERGLLPAAASCYGAGEAVSSCTGYTLARYGKGLELFKKNLHKEKRDAERAAELLVRLGTPKAVAVLEAAVDRPATENASIASAIALSAGGNPKAVHRLVDMFFAADTERREDMLFYFSRVSPVAMDCCMEKFVKFGLNNDELFGVAFRILRSLSEALPDSNLLRDSAVRARLLELAKQEGENWVPAAFLWIDSADKKEQTSGTFAALVQKLKKAAPVWMESEAKYGIVSLPKEVQIEILKPLLNADEESDRRDILTALARRRVPVDPAVAAKIYDEADYYEKIDTAWALEGVGAPMPLTDEELAAEALNYSQAGILENIYDKRAIPALERTVGNDKVKSEADPSTRQAAKRALKRNKIMTQDDPVQALIGELNDDDPSHVLWVIYRLKIAEDKRAIPALEAYAQSNKWTELGVFAEAVIKKINGEKVTYSPRMKLLELLDRDTIQPRQMI